MDKIFMPSDLQQQLNLEAVCKKLQLNEQIKEKTLRSLP